MAFDPKDQFFEGTLARLIDQHLDRSQLAVLVRQLQGAAAETVTSLPTSPYDGQQIYYLADATNGVVWNLVYRAASASAYKWEFVGGSKLSTNAGSALTFTTTAAWTAIASSPSITVPLNGDYFVGFAAGRVFNSTAADDIMIGAGTSTSTILAAGSTRYVGSAVNQQHAVSNELRQGVAAASVISMYGIHTVAGTVTIDTGMTVAVLPVRVG